MDDDQRQLLKVGAETAMKPFANLIEKLFGGAAEQIGGMLEDALSVRRQSRRVKLLTKLKVVIEKAEFDPRCIPDKLWLPVMQQASLEDDETIQDMWANLLANAADPAEHNQVLPSFVTILKDLTARDAGFLNNFYEEWVSKPYNEHGLEYTSPYLLKHLPTTASSSEPRYPNVPTSHTLELTLSILERSGLLIKHTRLIKSGVSINGDEAQQVVSNVFYDYQLTVIGESFVVACRSPSVGL